MVSPGSASENSFASRRSVTISAISLLVGALVGFAVLLVAVSLQTTRPDELGLGLNTISLFEPHPKGAFQFSDPDQIDDLSRDPGRFGNARRILWLGASQLYGVNSYQPGQHNVAYKVFDALLPAGTAVINITQPLCSPQEHELFLDYTLGKTPLAGLVIAAVYPDMRHETVRAGNLRMLDDPQTRKRIEASEHGRGLIALHTAVPGSANQSVPGPDQAGGRLMAESESAITGRLQRWIGLETLRDKGRAMVRIFLDETRRYFESLRARMTRDLSRYRIPILPQPYRESMDAWKRILATAKANSMPVLVYIAPRPTDFYPFDPDGYAAFKKEIEALARESGAAFLNIENAVPDDKWGEVDLTFGFYVRDPYHFTSEGHELMAQALLPSIRKTFSIQAP